MHACQTCPHTCIHWNSWFLGNRFPIDFLLIPLIMSTRSYLAVGNGCTEGVGAVKYQKLVDRIEKYEEKYGYEERIAPWSYLKTIEKLKDVQRDLRKLDNTSHLYGVIKPFLKKWGKMARVVERARDVDWKTLGKILQDLESGFQKLRGKKLHTMNFNEKDVANTIRGIYGKRHLVRYLGGTTCISKILHVLNPEVFVMWDKRIRGRYKEKNFLVCETQDGYLEFLREAKNQIGEAFNDRQSKTGKSWDEIEHELRSRFDNKTLAKLVDEYNWIERKALKSRTGDSGKGWVDQEESKATVPSDQLIEENAAHARGWLKDKSDKFLIKLLEAVLDILDDRELSETFREYLKFLLDVKGRTLWERQKRLEQLGFQLVGEFFIEDNNLNFTLHNSQQENGVYIFLVDGRVRYVGIAQSGLKKRMSGYKNPGPSQKTNIRIKEKLLDQIRREKKVPEIWFMPNNRIEALKLILPQETAVGTTRIETVITAKLFERFLIRIFEANWNLY